MTNNTTDHNTSTSTLEPPATYRLAAIDLDGTLLGPDLTISRENQQAIDRLAHAGIQIVLASGRHYRSMAPFTHQLPHVRWIVSSQGAEVATADRSSIIAQNFLRHQDLSELIHAASLRNGAFTPVYYTADEVFITTTPDNRIYDYAILSGRMPVRTSHDDLLKTRVQKIIWIGEAYPIADLRHDSSLASLGLQGVQTMDTLYEFMPLQTTKAWGLEILSNKLGIKPHQVVAFGDAENDIPMFDWAGRSYAMPHGWPAALTAATHTAPAGPPHTAFARAVQHLLS